MKDILLDIIGEYEAIEVSETVTQLDWPWIASAVLFVSLIIMTSWFACKVICGVLRD